MVRIQGDLGEFFKGSELFATEEKPMHTIDDEIEALRGYIINVAPENNDPSSDFYLDHILLVGNPSRVYGDTKYAAHFIEGDDTDNELDDIFMFRDKNKAILAMERLSKRFERSGIRECVEPQIVEMDDGKYILGMKFSMGYGESEEELFDKVSKVVMKECYFPQESSYDA